MEVATVYHMILEGGTSNGIQGASIGKTAGGTFSGIRGATIEKTALLPRQIVLSLLCRHWAQVPRAAPANPAHRGLRHVLVCLCGTNPRHPNSALSRQSYFRTSLCHDVRTVQLSGLGRRGKFCSCC